ncbi:MAG: hypothetical protein HFJ11_00050 [Bacilli bacterium]|nr:hypothetical protein [Bacilli bacterium]
MDQDFIALRNRIVLAVLVAIVFTIPLIIFIFNKFGNNSSLILNSLNKKENLVLLVTKEECKSCEDSENLLKKQKVNYTLLNKDQETNYEKIIRKIGISDDDIIVPTIIYVEEGLLYSSLVTPTKKELISYIEINNLSEDK